jgi:hypothetical protein
MFLDDEMVAEASENDVENICKTIHKQQLNFVMKNLGENFPITHRRCLDD